MLSLLLIVLLMIFFLYTKESVTEQLLNQAYHNQYYHLMMGKIVSFLMPFLVTVLVMDHDQAYLKPLFAYFGRKKVLQSKLMLYFFIITWIYVVIGIIYHILPDFMTSYYILDMQVVSFFIHIYLDGLILAIIILWAIKEKYKAFSIFIPLFYILTNWLYEDYQNETIYYIIPFYSTFFSSFTLAYLYKLCYILLGLAITTRLMLREEIK
jgi:hypothetical protein